jgi:hypothetical protein
MFRDPILNDASVAANQGRRRVGEVGDHPGLRACRGLAHVPDPLQNLYDFALKCFFLLHKYALVFFKLSNYTA